MGRGRRRGGVAKAERQRVEAVHTYADRVSRTARQIDGRNKVVWVLTFDFGESGRRLPSLARWVVRFRTTATDMCRIHDWLRMNMLSSLDADGAGG